MPFPPVPVYPKAIDSDYTLFLVNNTVEAKICVENLAWSQEIEIVPKTADEDEVWPDNGFANIEGELFYYDSVEKNDDDRVYKLKGCARNLGGEKTKHNPKGSWVRLYVVAEQHNQLVDAVLKTENFIGYNFDPRQETLDWRIRNLQSLQPIYDDFSCPDVNFTFNITENDPVTGILISYLVEITPPGTINNYRLDFGDGEFTVTDFEGTHRYAVNTRIDPIVTVSNDKCQMRITPTERENPSEPPDIQELGLDFTFPEFPTVPDFTIVPCDVPEPDITLPPLAIPCISLEGQVGPIPSVIEGPTIEMVSQVIIIGPDNPVQILHSLVSIVGGDIPSIILIEPPIPPTIVIDPPIPPTIVLVPPASTLALTLDSTELPKLEIDWGTPPEMPPVSLTLVRPVKEAANLEIDPELAAGFGVEFADLLSQSNSVKVNYQSVGIPENINVIFPEKMPKLEVSDKIKVEVAEVKIPDINLKAPDSIMLESPKSIPLVFEGEPVPVKVETEVTIKMEEMPKIKLEAPTEKIVLELPKNAGIPITIAPELTLPVSFPDIMPKLEVTFPEVMPKIELKITMDELISKNTDGKNCVMIVPCTS